ncbi:ABC transporter permease [Fusobacterium perfoetens]|uniref:ABC transporter permease n=1 Tax=Fusobacterium perfoetens TaxID=852 RepID=UPI001F32174E|nr:ABC transporter permease [Fusobacterium perfoetens]MCF2612369.1 ABC transporter permease [Fusobacterium perfoetens]
MFLIKKIFTSIITLFLVSIISFTVLNVIPGDPILSKLGVDATKEQVIALKKEYGLDKPKHIAYIEWTRDALRGDMGESIKYSTPVNDLIAKRMGVTLNLAGKAMVITILFGFPLGLLSAMRNKKRGDGFLSIFNMIGISIPSFWIGLLLLMIFGIYLKVPIKTVTNILPAVTLAVSQISITSIYLKNIILEELNKDYVKAAIARGRGKNEVIITDVLRNILFPMLTIVSGLFVKILAGSVIVESLFNIPGLGSLMVLGVENRDYPVVQALVLYSAIIVIVTNLFTDLLYSYVDPRVKIS